MDAELGALASRYVRDHDDILKELHAQLGSAVAIDRADRASTLMSHEQAVPGS